MENKKQIVELLKEWVELTELKVGTYQRYRDAANKSANYHTDQGDHAAHQSGDETAGAEHFAKRDKRRSGIQQANKRIHVQKRKENNAQKGAAQLKPVEIKSSPSLGQRIRKSMGME